MKIDLPAGAVFGGLAAIKAAVSEAYHKAYYDARRSCGHRGLLASRGKSLHALDARGDVLAGEAESWMWDGTLASLSKAMEDAAGMGAAELTIEGGFNWSASPRHLASGDYDPWVESWSVTVWKGA